jgi:hypothetical protein
VLKLYSTTGLKWKLLRQSEGHVTTKTWTKMMAGRDLKGATPAGKKEQLQKDSSCSLSMAQCQVDASDCFHYLSSFKAGYTIGHQ